MQQHLSANEFFHLNYDKNNLYKIKKIYNECQKLTIVQILNNQGRIQKCMFYDETSRLSNVCIYNTDTGKEMRNVTFKQDGKQFLQSEILTPEQELFGVFLSLNLMGKAFLP